jgi:hypothetical protein
LTHNKKKFEILKKEFIKKLDDEYKELCKQQENKLMKEIGLL